MMDQIIQWIFEDDSEITGELPSNDLPVSKPIGPPLIVLGVLEQVYQAEPTLQEKYMFVSKKCAEMVLMHSIQVCKSCR